MNCRWREPGLLHPRTESPEGDTKVKKGRLRTSPLICRPPGYVQLVNEPVAHATRMNLPPSGLKQQGIFVSHAPLAQPSAISKTPQLATEIFQASDQTKEICLRCCSVANQIFTFNSFFLHRPAE